jgi:16S rRNA (guanine527-N7)-methyltransferase
MQFSDCNVSDNFAFLTSSMKAKDLFHYFPQLTDLQKERFELLDELYQDWNQRINVVSRKDIEELYLRHVLHSLAIALFQEFKPGSRVIDVGTGGGFPGIPLAILFPEVSFTLVDSIGKKIKVVDEVVRGLGLTNVISINDRVENVEETFDFIISRAVAAMPTFVHWIEGKIRSENKHERANGILYLKGGDLTEELALFKNKITVYDLYDRIPLDFFETKRLVYLPLT